MKALYILDEFRNPTRCDDPVTFAKFFSNSDNFIIEKTKIGRWEISTVFLGVDAEFETIVKLSNLPIEQRKYRSLEEAEAGHTKIREEILCNARE